MHRRVQQVDVETGEVLEGGTLVLLPQRPRIREGWFMTFQQGLRVLAADKSLTATQLRVLLYAMAQLDFENYIHLSQAQIARDLGIQPPNVSAAVAALVKKRVLAKGPKVGRVTTLRLSPDVGWKGHYKNLMAERKRSLKLVEGGKDPVRQADAEAQKAIQRCAELGVLPTPGDGSAGPHGPK
jgi:DNA-binding MarR family transcriptional regulator